MLAHNVQRVALGDFLVLPGVPAKAPKINVLRLLSKLVPEVQMSECPRAWGLLIGVHLDDAIR